jgi:hypothetical protein
MLATQKIAAPASNQAVQQASDYEATAAVIAMKNRPGSFASEADDDLICHLRMQPRWVVLQLPSYWLARTRGTKPSPRYESVAPLVAELIALQRNGDLRLERLV